MKEFFKAMHHGMRTFGQNIIYIINAILLSIVYIIGVGFTKILSLLAGKSFLQTEMKKDSYWEKLNLKKTKIDEYYRQF